jgi:hypothetical protein
MFKKIMLLITVALFSGCTLLSIPVAVVETTAGIVKVPITVVGKVAGAVNGEDEETEEE